MEIKMADNERILSVPARRAEGVRKSFAKFVDETNH